MMVGCFDTAGVMVCLVLSRWLRAHAAMCRQISGMPLKLSPAGHAISWLVAVVVGVEPADRDHA